MKKRWILAVVGLSLLAFGVAGGTLLAHELGTDGDSESKSFASRVATILGLGDEEVKDAFNQARREIDDEAIQRKLGHLVEQGVIDQAQADQDLDWYRNRPEGIPDLFLRPGIKRGPLLRSGLKSHLQGRLFPPNLDEILEPPTSLFSHGEIWRGLWERLTPPELSEIPEGHDS